MGKVKKDFPKACCRTCYWYGKGEDGKKRCYNEWCNFFGDELDKDFYCGEPDEYERFVW